MQAEKRGSRGKNVTLIQVGLNAHLRPTPLVHVDGVFGKETEQAVRDFQRKKGLIVDGIVGLATWTELLAPPDLIDANLRKFVAQLGTVGDFVDHVARLEKASTRSSLFDGLSDFFQTAGGARYLLIKEAPRVIDFRHFFAAAAETHAASLSTKRRSPVGGGRGNALLGGLANEVIQCVDEGLHSKVHSCFSREDLGSNRLGAEFGRHVTIAWAEARTTPVSVQLRTYLEKLGPQAPKEVSKAMLPGSLHVAREGFVALMTAILDGIVPDAY